MSSSSDQPKKIIRLRQPAEAGETPGEPAPGRRPVRGRHLSQRELRARRDSDDTPNAAVPAAPAARAEKPADDKRRRTRPTNPAQRAPRPEQDDRRRERPVRAEQSAPRGRNERPATARDTPRPPRRDTETHHRDSPAGDDRPRRAPRPRQDTPAALRYFAACHRGLEEALARELTDLGAEDAQAASGGVGFSGDARLGWKINLWSRLAIRVLRRVGEGHYRDEQDLYQAALALPWPEWFTVDRTIAVRTVAHACPLKSLNFVTLKVKDAICDRFRSDTGSRPDVAPREPQVPILVYLDRERYNLYLDLSGDPLNRRGYRVEPAPAPLNENLAAGILALSGWTPGTPLLDPMMGGGTVLIEAALMALNRAPGLRRHFAFEQMTGFDRVEWQRLRKDAEAAAHPPEPLPIYGCDIDPLMVRATGLNLKAAGLLDCVAIDEGDVLEVGPPEENGLMVSNPPYGVRLGMGDMAAFYKSLGDALKQHFTGWTAHFLSADPDFPKGIGLKATRRQPLFNGPLECRLYEYRLVAGEMRGKR